MSIDSKKYALVKWLENKQFDHNNELTGRITSVLHTNIIDIEADYLRTGMQINVFRNGEIWRAQVIIPKTTMSGVDLAPSNNKIRTIVLPIKDTEMTNVNDTTIQNTFQEVNDYDDTNNHHHHHHLLHHNNNNNNHHHHNDVNHHDNNERIIVDNNNNDHVNNNCNTNLLNTQYNNNESRASASLALTAAVTSTASNTILSCNNNNNSNNNNSNNHENKDWQLLNSALNESNCFNDFYHQFNNNVNKLTVNNNIVNNDNNNNNINNNDNNGLITNIQQQQQQQQMTSTINTETGESLIESTTNTQLGITLNNVNFEIIFNMQNELINQQKELKLIEIETLEQVKQLHRNVNKLNKKFEEFIKNIDNIKNPSQAIKTAKSSLNKLNNSIQQYCFKKIVTKRENELNLSNHESILNEFNKTSSTVTRPISPLENTTESSSMIETTPITTSTTSSSSSPSLITLTPVKLNQNDHNLLIQNNNHYEVF